MVKKEQKQKLAIYRDKKGNVEFRAEVFKDTIWATLNQIADLFGVQKSAISKHFKNIFDSNELAEKATVSKMKMGVMLNVLLSTIISMQFYLWVTE
jgi:hypothetical protein